MSTDPTVNPYAAVPFHFWTGTFFVFGAMVGSFLNVVIHRLPRDMSVVHPRSHCPSCEYSIPMLLNIPIITWLVLGGRCANCKAPISARYFLVEAMTGGVFAACWVAFGTVSLGLSIALCILIAGLIASTFIDFEHFIIPDQITIGGCVAGLIASAIVPELHRLETLREGLTAGAFGLAAGGGSVYLVLRFGKMLFGRYDIDFEPGQKMVFTDMELVLPDKSIPYGEFFVRKNDHIEFHADRLEMADRCFWDKDVRISATHMTVGDEEFDPEPITFMEAVTDSVNLPREAMGFGDVKFMAAIGAFLGWHAVLFSLIVSSLLGSLVGVSLIVLGRREWSSRLPYGPYIAVAAVLWIFFSDVIVAHFAPVPL